jgi:hypothetical protein
LLHNFYNQNQVDFIEKLNRLFAKRTKACDNYNIWFGQGVAKTNINFVKTKKLQEEVFINLML